MKLQRPDPGIDAAKSGLHGKAGIFFNAGLLEKGEPRFDLQDLDPYLVFDSRESMLGTLENPTLDLDPATPSTLDVITATRAGVATYTDPDGLIATASPDTVRVDYTQGAELTPTVFQHVVQTDYSASPNVIGTKVTLSDISGPDGESGGVRVTETADFTQHYLVVKTKEIVSGTTYTVSFYVKEGAYSYVTFYTQSAKVNSNVFMNFSTGNATFGGPDLVSNSGSFTSVGGGWYRVVYSATAHSSGEMDLYVCPKDLSSYRGDVNNFTDYYGFQIEEGTTATTFVANTTGSPKFITGATYGPRVPMILVEPSSENLWGWSEGTLNDYQTNAVLYGGQYLSTDATSRNGLNSWLYFQPSSDTQVGFRMPVSVTSGSTMILSFYVIMDDGSKPRVGTSSTGSDTDFAILLQGSSSAGVYGGVEHIDGDLYRVWAYRVFTGTSNGQYIYRYGTHSGKGFKISGVMFEESSVPTSYIPTSGGDAAARTRAADDLEIFGSDFSDFFNTGGDGTFYAEFVPKEIETVNNIITGHGGGGGGLFLYSNYPTYANVRSYDGTQATSYGDANNNEINRASMSYTSSTFRGSLNGSAEDSQPHNGTFSTKNHLRLGYNIASPISFKRVIYWPYSSENL